MQPFYNYNDSKRESFLVVTRLKITSVFENFVCVSFSFKGACMFLLYAYVCISACTHSWTYLCLIYSWCVHSKYHYQRVSCTSSSTMYVCMYVCMYVRTYVCMYICMYVCIYVYMHTHTHARTWYYYHRVSCTSSSTIHTHSLTHAHSHTYGTTTRWWWRGLQLQRPHATSARDASTRRPPC